MSFRRMAHERNFMKKKELLIICIFSLLLIGVIFYGIHLKQVKEEAKKEAEEKRELEILYYEQNRAFWLTCDRSKIYSYFSFKDADYKNKTALCIYAYNSVQSDYELTLDEFYTYINKEYDSNGKPMIYSQPENIKRYIDWYFKEKKKNIDRYEIAFIGYLVEKGENRPYTTLSYEEVIANLEEFQKDPEYNPFIEG